MKHCDVLFRPANQKISIHAGATLLEAAGQAGLILSTPCGGTGRCGKCIVQLLPSQKSVRACQYIVEHDLTVSVPESSSFFEQKILEHGIQKEVDTASAFRKVYLENPQKQIQPLCDTLSKILSDNVIADDTREALLATELSSCPDNNITAVLQRTESAEGQAACWYLKGIEPGDTTDTLYGAAVDIGTTTVVARLVNLKTGQTASVASTGNPQCQYGADVISRISYCEEDSRSMDLHQAIISCLNELIELVIEESGLQQSDIYELCIVGNTTMNHLLLKYPVTSLGQAPYQAHSLEAIDHAPSELGININEAGNIHVLPNIAGFVGSDTVAAALACGLDTTEMNTLLVDIGTNGEIVLTTQSGTFAASCAAGPALEGAGIVCGSRAQLGAVERVVLDDGDIDVDVIGPDRARTLCGSGLIDAVAVMLELGIVDSTGRFCGDIELDPMLPHSIKNRLITHGQEPAFVLAGTYTDNKWESAVFLTQKDIRQLQLAKAAIRAGIELLLKKAGFGPDAIQQLLLAGAFGNYIQKKSALRIGLLPGVQPEKIHFVGNAAGSGAKMALQSTVMRGISKTFAREIEYVEIAHQADFQMVFSEFLLFPEN